MATVKKRLLLVGIPAFLAEELTEVFEKEDWAVLIPEKELSDENMADYFAAKLPDVLIYRLESERDDCIAHLDQLLSHAMKAKVSHILLLEEAGVFHPGIHALEDSIEDPLNRKGRRFRRMESLASIWRTNEKLTITLVRIPSLYGKGQKPGDGLIGEILDHAFRGEKAPILTASSQPFLSAGDAAYGLLRCVLSGKDLEIVHLGPGTSLTWDEFSALATPLLPEGIRLPETDFPENLSDEELDHHLIYGSALLDGSLAENKLGWSSRNDDREEIRQAVEEIIGAYKKQQADEKELQKKKEKKDRLERLVPFAENIAGFLIMALVLAVRIISGSRSPFDFNYLYIGTMGLLYGKQQSLLAGALSVILLIIQMVTSGRDPYSMLYDPMSFLHLISYFFISVLTGYFADREKYEEDAAKWQESRDKAQISFLRNLLRESQNVRDKLYRQVVNSEDSLGRVYHIIHQLDSREEEEIYTGTASVTSELLDISDLAIYAADGDGRTLRRRVHLGRRAAIRPASLEISKHSYLTSLMENGKIFMNRQFLEDAPDLAAPVMADGKVVAVIELHGLSFDQWSYHEECQLSLIARLAGSALSRAAAWDKAQGAGKFLPDTRILRRESFEQMMTILHARHQKLQDDPGQLFILDSNGLTPAGLSEKVCSCIYSEDFIGEYRGGYAVLFPDTPGDALPLIEERFRKAGLSVLRKEEVV